ERSGQSNSITIGVPSHSQSAFKTSFSVSGFPSSQVAPIAHDALDRAQTPSISAPGVAVLQPALLSSVILMASKKRVFPTGLSKKLSISTSAVEPPILPNS